MIWMQDLKYQEATRKTIIPAALRKYSLRSVISFLKPRLPVSLFNAKNDTRETLASSSDAMGPELDQVIVAPGHTDDQQRAGIERIVKASGFESPQEFGGIQGTAEALDSDLNIGIPAGNIITEVPLKAFIQKSSKSWRVILLLVYTILSLVFAVIQRNGWLELFFTVVAMVILVLFPALREYWKQKLPGNGEMVVEVIRGTHRHRILASNVLVGDDVCEGMGNQLTTNESRKPLVQAQLEKVITYTEVVGLVVSILVIVVMMLHLTLTKESQDSQIPDSKGKPKMLDEIIDFIRKVSVQGKIASLAIYLVGVMEGFPFVLVLAINYWNQKTLGGKASAKQPFACVSMGPVTNIVTDNLMFLGMTGLEDTKDAMKVYKDAGVDFKVVSRDNNLPALKSDALKSGLLMPNSDKLVINAEIFRAWPDEEKKKKVDKIAVMGNAAPADMELLVKWLKKIEKVVAVFGDKADDVPALKEADLGIAVGNRSTEIVREISDICVLDGDSMFLTTLISCGRCVYENIRKYIQLELTMLGVGLSVSSITAAFMKNSTITAVQFLWINLIVTAFGGLALLTQPAAEKQMQNPPTGRTERLITNAMWRNIITQASYQTVILVTFFFKGEALLGINGKVRETIAFNTFALCQVFNILNSREPEMKNVFKSIHQHVCFCVAVVLAVASQEVFMLIAHIFANDAWLNWKHQAVCFLTAASCLAVDSGLKCVSEFIMDILTKWSCTLRTRTCTGMTKSGIPESASVLELTGIVLNSNISEHASSIEVSPNLDIPSVDSDAITA